MNLINRLRILSIIAILLFNLSSYGRRIEPVKWESSVKRIDYYEVELLMTAFIDDGWRLYSQFVPEGKGPISTKFKIKRDDGFELVKNVIEPKPINGYDSAFEKVLPFFETKATFKQKIKLRADRAVKIIAEVYFMTCDNKWCIPPNTVKFEFYIPSVYQTSSRYKNIIQEEILEQEAEIKEKRIDDYLVNNEEESQDLSLLLICLLSLGIGFLIVLTPCVHPLISFIHSFFLHAKKDECKRGNKSIFRPLAFSISIVAICVLIGTLVAITLGDAFTIFISKHWIPNVLFFLLFIVFAAAFFGMFKTVLPSWMKKNSNKPWGRSGHRRAFFIALTFVVVSFSCTALIAATILSFSLPSIVIDPIVEMLIYSLAFAIPLTISIIGFSWLWKLSKSNNWLNSLKVIIGFIEVALAFKFLSIADQTYQWGILDREIFIALMIVIYTLIGFYLLGKIKFSIDKDMKTISVPRLGLAIVAFAFVVYLIPGMVGAPLKALSAWLPPQSTHDFNIVYIVKDNTGAIQGAIKEDETTNFDKLDGLCEEPKYADILHLPHGLEGYFDIDQAKECAKSLDKPVFIHFTGHGVVGCREMEAILLGNSKVLKRLKEKFIVTALFVDDKTMLPEKEWITSTIDGKVKKTLGDKNWDYQKSEFNSNAQPFYCLIGDDGRLLVKPKGYDMDVDAFVEFLDKGVENYKKKFKK